MLRSWLLAIVAIVAMMAVMALMWSGPATAAESPVLAALMARDAAGFVPPARNRALQALLAKKPPLSFIEACGVGDAAEVERQLRAQPKVAGSAQAQGWTALHYAAFSGNATTVALVLAASPDIGVNVRGRNRFRNTPLMAAVLAGQHDTARLLLERGADALVRQAEGYSPLHEAALLGRRDLVDLLLAHGAEINVRANDGRTPLTEALRGGHRELADHLRSKGAVAAAAAARPATVFLVRHAERPAPNGDVPLSAAGRARALELAAVLRDHRVDRVFISQMQRTRETAAPIAARWGVTAEMVPVEDVATLVSRLAALGPGQTALVVNHGGKLPEIITRLGGPKVEAIAEDEFDRLFVLARSADGTGAVVHFSALRYGAGPASRH
jgi:phosphohistidine phosphatase SixA